MKNKILNIAHRGYSAKYPENTMISFEKAIENQCDMIELDIHLSKDGILMVHHDFDLGRTDNGKGTIFDYTAHELQSLDAGTWFGSEFQNEKIPQLSEVFARVRNEVLMNVEIKRETLKSAEVYQYMATAVLDLVDEHQLDDRILISSFDWEILRLVREKNSEIQLGLLNHEPENGLRLDQAYGITPYSYHMKHQGISAPLVEELHENDFNVYTYTVNELTDFEILSNIGVDGIITNEVEKLFNYLNVPDNTVKS